MTTQISLAGFTPSIILRHSLILLLCATPPMVFAQPSSTPSAPGSSAVPTIAENLSVTPKFGQTQEQLAADRADCRTWAKGQTGFDLGQIGGGVAPSDYNLRRQQFGRALAACLGGRGCAVFTASAPGIEIPPLCHADRRRLQRDDRSHEPES